MTVETLVLSGGAVGHVIRQRKTFTGSTYPYEVDRWFHYHQVGSVMAETGASGAVATTHHQDAFGNTQASWSMGLWGGQRGGLYHNTREFDTDTRLTYMYQRRPEEGWRCQY